MPKTPVFLFTEDEIALIRRVVMTVWNQIGYDVFQCSAECGDPLTNEGCVESCLDANRPSSFAGADGKRVESLIDSKIATAGYTRVLKSVIRQCQLRLA